MCTLHLFLRVFAEAPVVLAANRDELLDRPWDGPTLLHADPPIFGPRDRLAGGTWLGVNAAGVVAALANHQGTLSGSRPASFCSRGTVILDALRAATAEEARAAAERTAPACKAYTLLLADAETAFVLDRGPEGSHTYALEPGCHVVTNMRFRGPPDPKAARSLARMRALAARGVPPTPEEAFRFLADHVRSAPDASPLCIHPTGASRFGTSSAGVLEVGRSGALHRFLFAPGPPCRGEFVDVTPTFAHTSHRTAGTGATS